MIINRRKTKQGTKRRGTAARRYIDLSRADNSVCEVIVASPYSHSAPGMLLVLPSPPSLSLSLCPPCAVMYDRTSWFSRGPARQTSSRCQYRRCGRKPGRYANRGNIGPAGRWISRISEGLMDIRIPSAEGLRRSSAVRPRVRLSPLLHRGRVLPRCVLAGHD